jgi:hypothetical protein
MWQDLIAPYSPYMGTDSRDEPMYVCVCVCVCVCIILWAMMGCLGFQEKLV